MYEYILLRSLLPAPGTVKLPAAVRHAPGPTDAKSSLLARRRAGPAGAARTSRRNRPKCTGKYIQ